MHQITESQGASLWIKNCWKQCTSVICSTAGESKKLPSSKITSLPSSLAYSIWLITSDYTIFHTSNMFAVPVNGPLKGVPGDTTITSLVRFSFIFKLSDSCLTRHHPVLKLLVLPCDTGTQLPSLTSKCGFCHEMSAPQPKLTVIANDRLPCIDKFSKHWPSNMGKLPMYNHLKVAC